MYVSVLPAVKSRPRRVAIGAFDGVHLGHQRVIQGCDTVLTFDRHPLTVLRPEAAPRLLTDRTRKFRRLEALGVREVVLIPFDRAWAGQPAEVFIDEVLVDLLDARHVSVGANFRFGARGLGDAAMLESEHRLASRVVPMLTLGGEAVSSTRIRRLVATGDVEAASALLGAPLTVPAALIAAKQPTGAMDEMAWLDFERALTVPAPGRYGCLVDGIAADVVIEARRSRLLVGPSNWLALSKASEVEVEFHRNKSDGRARRGLLMAEQCA